ncbi:MAG: type VI secretion system tip protein VgrG [Acidobacteriia bacterium]|nr:type VI secretion system tip protein VgrG [Terriglobia bacterium]
MPKYTQADRPLAITTPLGKDSLLLTRIRGHEAVSQLFHFQLDLLAEAETQIRFDRILGQNVTVELRIANDEKRYFNGLVKRFSQGARDDASFVHFRAEVVPKLWLLTKKVRCRTFQHLSAPDILRQVFTGLDVTYELVAANYHPRDYCVQYRESDFDFASRLMEEEGIYYFFKHTDGNHQMVVTDASSPVVAGQSTVIYEEAVGGVRPEMRVTAWDKTQELRSGEYTLRDHCFELPASHLEAKQKTVDSVTVGKVTHKLNVGGNDQLEIYDYPGGYAQRFDGIDRGGAPKQQDLKHIFADRDRTIRIRMEEEQAASLDIRGASDCGNFTAGHKFTLQRHFDANGAYFLTGVEHHAHLSGYRSDETPEFSYENQFTCIPAALRYRPQRVTPRPQIAGIQTATVVGPAGEEIFCDRYGRVKVQFHWDREGKKNADSSCWVRVSQVWAGKGWGAFFWPRIGHEVVVTFEEGDPDQPLIIGSVYNAENMPPFRLPGAKKYGGFKSSSVHGAKQNFNGIMFVDEKGKEHLSIHSERFLVMNAEFDRSYTTGRHQAERVPGARTLTVGRLPGTE